MVAWERIRGPRYYRPEQAAAAERALAAATTELRAGRAVAELRYAVSNDHAGTLYPAAVPAVDILLRVILRRTGEPRALALDALLDWWGSFRPEPEFDSHDDPSAGSVEVTAAIMDRVRAAAPELRNVATGDHRRPVGQLLSRLAQGWTVEP
ncbi:hypothetical protein NDR87_03445 [Nocardia sp. CDC159]|uniref:Uncharacterized protein n=1 Tax=Nocardia pulmonis TaxID=2951408 RepID=A0A9X2E310_9NOCA|nr:MULTISPECIES: hypothetical protein [Nocardia]MCM6771930.1 hypothetical protein [Nocardia pulmonis]MCM6785412.1 hypothetical protein [Nocardia sp. CDC159]